MFEFHAYDTRAHVEPPLAPLADRVPTEPVDIAAISFLFWSEHCVECAAPACYATCALYRPRKDRRCRRFAFGLFRNTRFAGLRGYGAEVAFRRWGKLKANGNTWMEPRRDVIRRELWLGWTIPARRFIARVAGVVGFSNAAAMRIWADPTRDLDRRARRLHRRLARERDAGGRAMAVRPDAFLIEVFSAADGPVSLELEMRVAEDLIDTDPTRGAPPAFRHIVHLDPGHNRHIVPHGAFAAVSDCGLPFKLSVTPIGEAMPRLAVLALDFVTWRTPPATLDRSVSLDPSAADGSDIQGPAIKCVVFDLDNTVWQGTLVEGGASDLVPEARRVLGELDRRGILLAIASRNDAGPALARLGDFGLADLFVAIRIDWRLKSRAIIEMAAHLNLGLDTFAFVDDSAFERAEVGAALPKVACFDASDLGALVDHPRLRGGTSETARDRRRLYQEAARREERRSDFIGEEEAFLRSCRLRLEIAPYRSADRLRVAELAQRTNQLNASGKLYDAKSLTALIDQPELVSLVLRCIDIHGDYGVVGFAPVRFGRNAQIRVEEFMLSCRVQGRGIEAAFFHHLASSRRAVACGSLWINFRATGRNTALVRILDDLKFRSCVDGARVLDLPAPQLACDLVDVVDPDEDDPGSVDAATRLAVA